MVNVRTGHSDWACIRATTVEESMPPERNAPTGTSAAICRPTARSNTSCSASTASSGAPSNGRAWPDATASPKDQYGRGSGHWPPGSREAPAATLT